MPLDYGHNLFWDVISSDQDAKARQELIVSAKLAASSYSQFLAAARSETEFEERLALVQPDIEHKVASIVTQAEYLDQLPEVRKEVLSSLQTDWHDLDKLRRTEQARRIEAALRIEANEHVVELPKQFVHIMASKAGPDESYEVAHVASPEFAKTLSVTGSQDDALQTARQFTAATPMPIYFNGRYVEGHLKTKAHDYFDAQLGRWVHVAAQNVGSCEWCGRHGALNTTVEGDEQSPSLCDGCTDNWTALPPGQKKRKYIKRSHLHVAVNDQAGDDSGTRPHRTLSQVLHGMSSGDQLQVGPHTVSYYAEQALGDDNRPARGFTVGRYDVVHDNSTWQSFPHSPYKPDSWASEAKRYAAEQAASHIGMHTYNQGDWPSVAGGNTKQAYIDPDDKRRYDRYPVGDAQIASGGSVLSPTPGPSAAGGQVTETSTGPDGFPADMAYDEGRSAGAYAYQTTPGPWVVTPGSEWREDTTPNAATGQVTPSKHGSRKTAARECDIHKYEKGQPGVPAVYDGKTVYGPWANMCEDCAKTHAVDVPGGPLLRPHKASRRTADRQDDRAQAYHEWASAAGHNPDDLRTLRMYEQQPGISRAHADEIADIYHGVPDTWRSDLRMGVHGSRRVTAGESTSDDFHDYGGPGRDAKGHQWRNLRGVGKICANCGMDAPERGEWTPSCQEVQRGFGDHKASRRHASEGVGPIQTMPGYNPNYFSQGTTGLQGPDYPVDGFNGPIPAPHQDTTYDTPDGGVSSGTAGSDGTVDGRGYAPSQATAARKCMAADCGFQATASVPHQTLGSWDLCGGHLTHAIKLNPRTAAFALDDPRMIGLRRQAAMQRQARHPSVEPPRDELVDCPRCGGQGGEPGSNFGDTGWHPCYHCGASGKVSAHDEWSGREYFRGAEHGAEGIAPEEGASDLYLQGHAKGSEETKFSRYPDMYRVKRDGQPDYRSPAAQAWDAQNDGSDWDYDQPYPSHPYRQAARQPGFSRSAGERTAVRDHRGDPVRRSDVEGPEVTFRPGPAKSPAEVNHGLRRLLDGIDRANQPYCDDCYEPLQLNDDGDGWVGLNHSPYHGDGQHGVARELHNPYLNGRRITSSVPADRTTCPTCRGRGDVGEDDHERTCPTCGGAGWWEKGDKDPGRIASRSTEHLKDWQIVGHCDNCHRPVRWHDGYAELQHLHNGDNRCDGSGKRATASGMGMAVTDTNVPTPQGEEAATEDPSMPGMPPHMAVGVEQPTPENPTGRGSDEYRVKTWDALVKQRPMQSMEDRNINTPTMAQEPIKTLDTDGPRERSDLEENDAAERVASLRSIAELMEI